MVRDGAGIVWGVLFLVAGVVGLIALSGLFRRLLN
jgi:hypothetical protein